MIIGMGTPNNQSRMPRPIVSSPKTRTNERALLYPLSVAASGNIVIVHRRRLQQLLLRRFSDGVLSTAHGILNLPCRFLRGPVSPGLGVAGHLADSLLDGTFEPVCGTCDSIFVHGYSPDQYQH